METYARLQFPSFYSFFFSDSWCHPLTEPLQWLCSLLGLEGAVTVFSAGVRGAPVLWLLLCYGSDVKLRVSCQDGSRSHFPGLGLFIVPCTMALLPPAASIHHIPLLSNAHKSPWSWRRWTWQNFTSGRRISENHFPILSLEEVWHDHGIKAVEVTSHQSTALLKGKQRPRAPHIQRAPQFLRVHYDSAVALVPAAPAQPRHSRGSVFPNLSTGLATPLIQIPVSQSMFCPIQVYAMPYVLHLWFQVAQDGMRLSPAGLLWKPPQHWEERMAFHRERSIIHVLLKISTNRF